jgi:hypothetical protein
MAQVVYCVAVHSHRLWTLSQGIIAGTRDFRRIDVWPGSIQVSGSRPGCPGAEELEMTPYLIAFNDEWVPDLTLEELRERGDSGRAVIEEMKAADVFIFTGGGLDQSTAVCSVDPSSGSPVFTDGPYAETKEHLGGFAVVDVPDDADARYWAGRIAVAVGWAQEVHRFPDPTRFQTDAQSEALS